MDDKDAKDEHETERMLEKVIAANKEKMLRVAKDRAAHNKNVTRDYRLKR